MPAVRALVLAVALAIAGPVAASPAQAAPRAAVEVSPQPGDPIFSDTGRQCVIGAYVTDGSADFILTAAACLGVFGDTDTWYADAAHTILVGTSSGGGGGLITPAPGVVPMQTFTGVGIASVGESVCVPVSATGIACGTITAVNVQIVTETGVIDVLRTSVCTPPGSLGAPLISAGKLLGIQALDGSCSGNGSFFEPVADIFARSGLRLL